MDILQAHALLCHAQRLSGPIKRGTEFEPLVGAALADLSGWLDDSTDVQGLRDAIEHGRSLVSCRVLSRADLEGSVNGILKALQFLSEQEEPCSTSCDDG